MESIPGSKRMVDRARDPGPRQTTPLPVLSLALNVIANPSRSLFLSSSWSKTTKYFRSATFSLPRSRQSRYLFRRLPEPFAERVSAVNQRQCQELSRNTVPTSSAFAQLPFHPICSATAQSASNGLRRNARRVYRCKFTEELFPSASQSEIIYLFIAINNLDRNYPFDADAAGRNGINIFN